MIFQVTCWHYPFKNAEGTRETEVTAVTAVSMKKDDWRYNVKCHGELHMKILQFVQKFSSQVSNICYTSISHTMTKYCEQYNLLLILLEKKSDRFEK